MKFSQLGQLALASAVSAALVLGITACGQSNTIDFVYVSSAGSSTAGNIYAYAADGESGALSQIVGSPFPTGRNPIALLTAPNNNFLYALNHDDNTVVEYSAGSDGKLYSQHTYNPKSGTNPNGMAISPDGKRLYVVEAYGLDPANNPFSATTPGVGALVVFPINADGSLGTEASYQTCNNPVAVSAVPDGSALYVVNDPAGQLTTLIDTVAQQNRGATGSSTVIYPTVGNCSGGASAVGQISSYVVNADGTLSAGSGSPFRAGVAPVGIATDPTSRFTYVIDYRQNQILSYSIQPGGLLEPLVNSNQTTGQLPSAITIDPRGQFIYVTNYGTGTVSGYQLNAVTGVPATLAGAGSAATDVGPAAVIIEDAIGRYIYTANFVGNSASGLFLDPNAGTTIQVQNSPFPGALKATAVASVKHGNHAIQVNPTY